MSFLAQLRQQQTDTGQGLQLCYLLRIDRQQRSASLALTLSVLREGRMAGSGKAYVIQRPHLQTPPSFLDTGDVQRLQVLVDADSDWLRHSSGRLPELETWRFLHGLLDSGRCFVDAGSDHRAALAAATEQPIELHWVTDQAGWQRLDWRPCVAASLFFVSASLAEGFVHQPDSGTLARCHHGLDATALATALPCFQGLEPEAVTAVLRDRQRWRELGLPLPHEIVRQSAPATLTPVLHCASGSHPEAAGIQDVLRLRFRYCSEHFCVCLDPGAGAEAVRYWDGAQLQEMVRQPDRERSWQQQLAAYLPAFVPCEEPATWRAQNQQAWRQLLGQTRPALEAQGFQVAVAPGFRHHYVVAEHWEARIDRAGAAQWQLSVQLSAGGDPVDLLALLAQLSHHERTGDLSCLRLADDRLLLLPADKVSGLMAELGDLLQYASPAAGGGYRLPDTQIHRLHNLSVQLPDNTDWQGDLAALEQAADLHRTPEVLDNEDCGIRAQLRPYQWQGVCWLQHLRRHRANGLLADDMGLGKTLQTLAHLCVEHREGRLRAPALIVAPTSLLHNWAAEINRFAPHLRRKIIHGPQRHRQWERLRNFDVLITSYPLIVNDLPHWRKHPVSWVVLDEAQWIKNPRTQVSQAVRQLASDHRLCLSGTPVENHLGELWSILDFLMPRCLGSAGEFKRYFQTPIERDADSDRLRQLLQRVAPFMLRRSKDQVARDLPPKTEIHQTIDLADDQRGFYDELKTAGWAELQSHLADAARDGQRQILVLTALLKLRQACCDPRLLGETGVSSGKRAHCIEMIAELVAEGRAILVFSQFTAMLELLAEDLEQRRIGYLMLTGQTRDRQARVDAFQQGAAPVFLISLKAGGVGLNLTRADTVIHYDPWWNGTAEQQATDRAHRIGQDKPVFVYKLIAENTIEEKIARLQQRKALLSQHVNHQAQASGERFALELEELLTLFQQEATGKDTLPPC